MSRLPTPGGDNGDWGNVLNDFLIQAHNTDGTLKLDAITSAGGYIKPANGIPKIDLSSTIQASLSSADGSIQSINGKTGTSVTLVANDIGALSQTTADGRYLQLTGGTVSSSITGPIVDKGGQVFNVRAYGATGNGSTDDTIAIANTINAIPSTGGVVYLPAGTYIVSSPLPAIPSNVTFLGAGPGSILKLSSSWSGSSLFTLSNFNSTVSSLQFIGGSRTTNLSDASLNPTATMIEVAAGQYCTVRDIDSQYCNGWIIEAKGNTTNGCQGLIAENIRGTRNGYGIHTLGASGSSYNVQVQISNINMQQVSLGDVLLIEDSYDVQVSQVNAAVIGSVNTNASSVRIHGKCASIFLYNIDVGSWPTMPSLTPTVIIETGTNGTPEDVHLSGGIIQEGSNGIDITGTDVYISELTISQNGTGVVFRANSTGSVKSCTFRSNGQTTGPNYEINCISTQQPIWLSQNNFMSPQGSGIGYVSNVGQHSSFANGAAWLDNDFNGSGFTASTVFGLTPKYAFRNRGYNPFGQKTVAIPASDTATSGAPFDCFFYITAGTGGCSVTVGSTSITIPSGQIGTVFVPAGLTLTPTYTNAPTWTVSGN